MKSIKLIIGFLAKSKSAAVILVFSYTLVLLIANITFASVRYITYTRDVFVEYNSPNTFYCALDYDPGEIMESDKADPIDEKLTYIENNAGKYSAYQPFLKEQNFVAVYDGTQISCEIYDKEMVQRYPLALSEGSWEELKIESDDSVFTAVSSGAQFDGVKLGSVVSVGINKGGKALSDIKVKIVGKLAAPYSVPHFSVSGSIVTADYMFGNLDGLIFLKSDELINKINAQSSYAITTSGNFITTILPDATEKEQEEYITFLKNNFSVKSYDEIKLKSDEKVDREVRQRIPIPVFLLTIVSFALLSMSVLFVNKNIRDHAVYYMCGCSRKRSCAIVSGGVMFLGAVGGIINILFVSFYSKLSAQGILNLNNVLFDSVSILYTGLILLITVGTSVALGLIVFRKNTPIEIYRRVE